MSSPSLRNPGINLSAASVRLFFCSRFYLISIRKFATVFTPCMPLSRTSTLFCLRGCFSGFAPTGPSYRLSGSGWLPSRLLFINRHCYAAATFFPFFGREHRICFHFSRTHRADSFALFQASSDGGCRLVGGILDFVKGTYNASSSCGSS